MRRYMSMWFMVGIAVTCLAGDATAQGPPAGQLIIALSSSMTPAFFDPSEPGLTPPIFLYALHDALIKPLPENPMAPALATSWTDSPDGLVYALTLREGITFHNGDPFTAEDVKFSFLRYKGLSAQQLHERVKAIDILDPYHLRIVLHAPWPDFLTVYSAQVSRAAWIVPKQYIERVGDEGFKRHPIGLGPYRFVLSAPGVALVLEAYDRYWRKTPAIQQIICKGAFQSPLEALAVDSLMMDLAEGLLAGERCGGRPVTSQRVDVLAIERARQFLDVERTRVVHSTELEAITGRSYWIPGSWHVRMVYTDAIPCYAP